MKATNMKQLSELINKDCRACNSLKETKVIDYYFLMDVLTTYEEGKFIEMTRMIDEYGNHIFFQQLFIMFQDQNWRSQINKYMFFVGVTIQYMKYKPVDEAIELICLDNPKNPFFKLYNK